MEKQSHCGTLGSCLEDQLILRNPGPSQLCESFSAERRASTQQEGKKKTLNTYMYAVNQVCFSRRQQDKQTFGFLSQTGENAEEKAPSRHREWNSMKNLALLAVFTMASIVPSSIQDRSKYESNSK